MLPANRCCTSPARTQPPGTHRPRRMTSPKASRPPATQPGQPTNNQHAHCGITERPALSREFRVCALFAGACFPQCYTCSHLYGACPLRAEQTPKSCRELYSTEQRQSVGDNFDPPPSRWFITPKSSLTRTLVLTQLPPSRQMWATALSTAKPRRPDTPVVATLSSWPVAKASPIWTHSVQDEIGARRGARDFRPTEFSATRRYAPLSSSPTGPSRIQPDPQEHPKSPDLLTSRQAGVSSPHNCSWVDHPGCLGQCCASVRARSSTVPHFSLPVVNTDFGVSPEFLPIIVCTSPIRLAHHTQVVKICEQLLSSSAMARNAPCCSGGCGGRRQPHLPRGTWKGLHRTTLQRAKVAHLPSCPGQRSDGSLPVRTGNPRRVCGARHPSIDGPRRQRHSCVCGWGGGLSTSFHGI